jgi:hypothetical protein
MRSMERRAALLSLLLTAAPATLLAAACSDETIKAPASDKNFDDPDEPATPGQVGAVDASTADVVVSCGSDVDCPPRAARCLFALADGCGAKGTCVNYVEPTGCAKTRFCNCQGGGRSACAPAGFAPTPVEPGAACEESDAAPGVDAAADAPIDAPVDAG